MARKIPWNRLSPSREIVAIGTTGKILVSIEASSQHPLWSFGSNEYVSHKKAKAAAEKWLRTHRLEYRP